MNSEEIAFIYSLTKIALHDESQQRRALEEIERFISGSFPELKVLDDRLRISADQ